MAWRTTAFGRASWISSLVIAELVAVLRRELDVDRLVVTVQEHVPPVGMPLDPLVMGDLHARTLPSSRRLDEDIRSSFERLDSRLDDRLDLTLPPLAFDVARQAGTADIELAERPAPTSVGYSGSL